MIASISAFLSAMSDKFIDLGVKIMDSPASPLVMALVVTFSVGVLVGVEVNR